MNQKNHFRLMSLAFLFVAGLFTLSLSSCGDDDDSTGGGGSNEAMPTALKHTWQVATSTDGYNLLTGASDVIIDFTSGSSVRFFVRLTSDVANKISCNTTDYYFLSKYTLSFAHRSKSSTKGELRFSSNDVWTYQIVSDGVNLTIEDVTYGLVLFTLTSTNPLPPDGIYS